MLEQHLGEIAIGALTSVVAYFTKTLHGDVRQNEKDIANVKEDLGKNYVPKDEYRDDLGDIKDMLNKIFDKIDLKADKH
jgi:hypothetical protein